LKHNHKLVVAFAAGWLLAIFLPPQTVLGGLKGQVSGSA
jgi:hypothetical protein